MSNHFEMALLNREKKIYVHECVDLAKTFPEWKSPLLTVDYMLIQTHQEIIDAKTRMKAKEKEAEFYNSEMTNKWIDLKGKQENFLNDVENCNKFFIVYYYTCVFSTMPNINTTDNYFQAQENEEKCQRILRKLITEVEFHIKCKQNIFDAKKRNEYLEQLNNDMKRWVYSLQPYHEYMTNVTKQMEHVTDVSALVNNYILMSSEIKLQETFVANLLESELLHNELLKSLKAKMNMLSQQRSEFLGLKKYHLNKTIDLNSSNKKWKQKKSQTNFLISEVIFIKQAYDNIFQKLFTWKRKHFSEMNDEKRLFFIENTINELKNAVQSAYELSYKDDMSRKTDSSFITQKK